MYSPEKFVQETIQNLKETIKGKAIIGASGGVDSTVAAVLCSRAIGDQLVAVYVDTGYMRKGEGEEIKKALTGLGLDLRYIEAAREFSDALKGIVDPEEKRKIIGHKFIEIFEREAKKERAEYLIQGTIAPDWIESGGGLRDTIKSHHNVGGLPKKMDLKLVEPLRDLYKDEIREIAEYLNIPSAQRQPFPGPGLAIRIMGEATPGRTEIIREACAIVEGEIEKSSIERPWQYFAVLLPIKSVGVHGDVRAYGYTIVVRAVESLDAMTAQYSRIPHEVLERISLRITNTMGDKVNRVVYDITNKPPGTIEWE
ncbi:MAG: glutamine-hydrolyzing GMP synthase subunit GuaA [Thermoplasmata archaeon]|nr:glutamine-hydrolyzing GMP synthase subunit GuaA [Thermoplasmata archaeon]